MVLNVRVALRYPTKELERFLSTNRIDKAIIILMEL